MFRCILAGTVALLIVGQYSASMADEDVGPGPQSGPGYTSHAPGVVVPGKFHAGGCLHHAPLGAGYEPEVDAAGNAVVAADLTPHDRFHFSGPSLQYLFSDRREDMRHAREAGPQNYIVVDTQDGTVYYNDYALAQQDSVPPPPPPCG